MARVAEEVSQLQSLLGTNANEHELLDRIPTALSALRNAYREDKVPFSPEVVSFLRNVSEAEVALREFIAALDDRADVRSRDDAHELAVRFQEIAERLRPHLVSKRAEKEARELVEKSKSLPFAAVSAAEADFRRRASKLEQTRPRICGLCKSKMALRESQNGVFWGCTAFPKCFGRNWLNREENKILQG